LEERALPGKLDVWRHKIIAFASGLGAPGLLIISFLDSSFLTFPVVNDLILIELSYRNPTRMPLYAAMATLGSVAGCVILFLIARGMEEAVFHKRAGRHGMAIRHWVERNGFVGILVAALLPPPTPFKFFVLAAGIFEVPLRSFASAVSLARVFRYFGVGYLAIRYGHDALPFLAQHKSWVVLAGIALVAVSYALSKVILRYKAAEGPAEG
jgi:membrane protein YqaA with SNARE-associated domain